MVVLFRRRFGIGLAVVGASLAMAFGGTTGLAASPPVPATPTNATVRSAADTQRMQSAIRLLDPYVVRVGNGTLALNPPSSVLRKVGPALMTQFRSGLTTVNGEIRAGRLVATANHRLYDPTNTALSVQGGWTGVRLQWWGYQLYFSEYWTQRLLIAMGAGTSGLALCDVLPGVFNQIPCGILTAVLGGLIAYVLWVDNGNGVVFNADWTITYIWISGQ